MAKSKRELVDCWKCNGRGQYAHFGVCFVCKGFGKQEVIVRTEEEQAKVDARNEKRREAKRMKNVNRNVELYPWLKDFDKTTLREGTLPMDLYDRAMTWGSSVLTPRQAEVIRNHF
jgi:RecJ-like exonuclease